MVVTNGPLKDGDGYFPEPIIEENDLLFTSNNIF